MQITNGSITFERNRKTADYEGKKASVTLSFLIPEGGDAEAAAARVGQLAMNRALMMVGEIAQDVQPAHELPAAAPASVPAPRGRRAANPPPTTQPSSTSSNESAGAEKQSSPLAAAAAPATPAAAATGASPPASSVADPRLTDAGLRKAIENKIGAASNRGAVTASIHALIGEFTGAPALPIYSVADATKRAAFVQRLEVL